MVWANNISLAPPLFIEEHVLSKESERSCSCMTVHYASFYDLSIGFWNCSDRGYFLFIILIHLLIPIEISIWQEEMAIFMI